MKKILLIAISVIFLLIQGCGGSLNNSVTVKNTATNNIYLNAFGKILTLLPGQTQIIKNIQNGDYTYQTSYDIPASVTGTSAEGATEGTLSMGPSTKITIFYSSRIQTTAGASGSAQSNYILIVTISSSDKSTISTTSP